MGTVRETYDNIEEIPLDAWVDKDCCGGMGKAILRRDGRVIKLVCDNCKAIRQELSLDILSQLKEGS